MRSKLIPGYNGFYKVREDGTIWSCRIKGLNRGKRKGKKGPWRKMKLVTIPKRTGHLSVGLSKNGKQKHFAVHRLVLEAFVGPCPPGMQCRHYPDQDPTNNWLHNLSWTDHQTNVDDRIENDTNLIGERHPRSKLTEQQVLSILDVLRKEGHIAGTSARLAREYNVSPATICLIRKKSRWGHL